VVSKFREDMSTKKSRRLIANMEKARTIRLRATRGYDTANYDGSSRPDGES